MVADERVLGQGEFVKVLLELTEKKHPPLSLSERIKKMEQIILKRSDTEGMTATALAGRSKAGILPKIRADLARQLVHELGISCAGIARHPGISTAMVSKIVTDQASCRS